MNKHLSLIIVCAFFLSSNLAAQTVESINNRLSSIYSQVFENIDTAAINYREECHQLVNSTDKEMQRNGYITLALLDFYSDRYNTSIAAFKRALELDPLCYTCYSRLHWTYWYAKNNYSQATLLWKTAVNKFEVSVKEDSTDITRWKKLYQTYLLNEGTLKRETKNRVAYSAFKIVTLDSSEAYNWWQYSFYQDGTPTAKEYSLKKAFLLNQEIDAYWDALANFYAEHKNIVQLKELLEKVKPTAGEDPTYWYQQKARYLYSVGLKAEALAVYKEAKAKGFEIVYK